MSASDPWDTSKAPHVGKPSATKQSVTEHMSDGDITALSRGVQAHHKAQGDPCDEIRAWHALVDLVNGWRRDDSAMASKVELVLRQQHQILKGTLRWATRVKLLEARANLAFNMLEAVAPEVDEDYRPVVGMALEVLRGQVDDKLDPVDLEVRLA